LTKIEIRERPASLELAVNGKCLQQSLLGLRGVAAQLRGERKLDSGRGPARVERSYFL